MPRVFFPAAPSKNTVLTDYLHVLRNLQTQLNHVQSFLEAHIGLLEDIRKTQVEQEQGAIGFKCNTHIMMVPLPCLGVCCSNSVERKDKCFNK